MRSATGKAGVGETWSELCRPALSSADCIGGVWHVAQTLAPGESITLSSSALLTDTRYSHWIGFLAEGDYRIYVQVDLQPRQGIARAMGAIGEVDEGKSVLAR